MTALVGFAMASETHPQEIYLPAVGQSSKRSMHREGKTGRVRPLTGYTNRCNMITLTLQRMVQMYDCIEDKTLLIIY